MPVQSTRKALSKKSRLKPAPKAKPKATVPAPVSTESLEQLSREARVFPPPKEFSSKAHVKSLGRVSQTL